MRCLRVDARGEHLFTLAGVCDDVAVWTDHNAAAVVEEVWVCARAVDSNDEGEVLDRPRLQERQPVVMAFHRPACDNHHQVGSHFHCGAKVLGKTQVVADEGGHGKLGQRKGADVVARVVALALGTQQERLDFGVAGQLPSRGIKRHALVESLTAGGGGNNAAHDGAPVFARQCAQKGLIFACIRLAGDRF